MPAESPLSRLLREPLLHFVVLAVLLFVLDGAVSGGKKETIVVDAPTRDYLIEQREALELRSLTPQERRETIDTFIEDEILYREAYARGLDRGDSRMRRNLVLKMRGLLSGEVEPPSEDQLRAFFDGHPERFERPATWSVEQVFYADATKIPADLLRQLRAGLDPNRVGEDRMTLGRRLPRRTQRELAGVFGPDAARAILAIEDEQWHGPLESPRGIHFVRVIARTSSQMASFDAVQPYLEADWTMEQARSAVEQEVARLRDGYEIVIADGGDER